MNNKIQYKLNDMGEDGNLDNTIKAKMIQQVETLSNKYSKLLVVRVDLHVLDDVWLNDSKLIDKLLKNIRKTKYKDHLFGYFWVLEREKKKKGHYHMVFFFDGQQRRSEWAAQDMIEGCWQRVVSGGTIHRTKGTGTGMLLHGDQQKRADTIYALSYLCKKRGKKRLEKGQRLYGFSRLPKLPLKTSQIAA
ncbi:inovirus-type Gp2 protein [Aeromonas sp. FDAARGOS 1415]|uniref:YagK/YfjJ domain-containing protein n=1 Tax=Aeromonas TaxID=642 RepID=UPI001C24E486|nr:inovirus-type Gp2 protein [Aeromonas sp. FDAARGOS 1415]QXB56324.1 inovirus Gp2 family protein [Aeromonas sp. FDAARGOS 1415]